MRRSTQQALTMNSYWTSLVRSQAYPRYKGCSHVNMNGRAFGTITLFSTLIFFIGCQQSVDKKEPVKEGSSFSAFSLYQVTIQPMDPSSNADPAIEGSLAWHLKKADEAGGGTITLDAGDYILNESVVLPNHIRLVGDREKTRIIADTNIHDHLLNNVFSDTETGGGIQQIELSEITLIGKRTIRKNCVQLIASNKARSNRIALENITVSNCGRHGIHIKGANHVTLKNIEAFHNGQNIDHDHNIYLLRVTGATVQQIRTYEAAGNGLSSTRMISATIQDIESARNGKRGIRFGGGKDIVLERCVVKDNSTQSGRTGDGIVIVADDFHHLSQDITIRDCRISGNKGYGILISAAKNILLQENDILENGEGEIFQEESTLL